MKRIPTPKQKPEKKQALEPTTLLGHIEKIIELSEDSELSKEFFEKAKSNINFVKNVLQLSDMATVLFSLLVDNNDSRYTYIKELSEHLNCRKIRIMKHGESLKELENRRLVRCNRRDNSLCYRIPKDVIFALTDGKNIEPRKFDNLSKDEFFDYISELFEERKDDELLFTDLSDELLTLLDANPQLELSRKINNHHYSDENKVLLLYFCHLFVNEYDEMVGFHDFESIFEKRDLSSMKRSFKDGYHELIENKWIENSKSEDFFDANYFQLTDKAKRELLGNDILKKYGTKFDKKFIVHGAIKSKELFFDDYEREQIDKLTELLKPENFASVQKRLSENGMRNGFACLFYGAPGTGKTETAYQLARKTGRNILPVNVSEIKSMWVGETEKNIKKLFDEYRENVSQSEIAPILLFNEADAVLGTRMETIRAVDKMENAMQNIILQEMENLNGIMIATTNLTKNLDKAFERRFIYKIEFLKPTLSAKCRIWQNMLPNLTENEAEELALQYDFSGGQIENIVRKSTVEYILGGASPSMETLHSFCRSERLHNADIRPKIGFY